RVWEREQTPAPRGRRGGAGGDPRKVPRRCTPPPAPAPQRPRRGRPPEGGPAMNWTLTVALTLAREYPCFPCARNKRPSCPHGFKDATRDPAALQELFTRYPGSLIGVPTGVVSGIDVLDLDPKHAQARDWWAANW